LSTICAKIIFAGAKIIYIIFKWLGWFEGIWEFVEMKVVCCRIATSWELNLGIGTKSKIGFETIIIMILYK